jgi:hypothetical protein
MHVTADQWYTTQVGDEVHPYGLVLTSLRMFIGGFGHSGTAAVLKLGLAYQKMMGEEYDILGFDPRLASRVRRVLYMKTLSEGLPGPRRR